MFFISSNQAQELGFDPASADAPEVDRQLPGHRHDRSLARGPRGHGAFGQDPSPFHDRFGDLIGVFDWGQSFVFNI